MGNNKYSVKTGFNEFDELIQGCCSEELIIIAGRPSMGKTGFGLSIIRNLVTCNDIPIALFSFESSKSHVENRLLSIMGGTEEQLSNIPLYIEDPCTLNVEELYKRTEELVKKQHVKIVIIDYLQLISGTTEHVLYSLKALAVDLCIPVIVFYQLYKKIDGRSFPLLEDFGVNVIAINEVADKICFIYRPGYYKVLTDDHGNDLCGMTEFNIVKNSNRCIGRILLKPDGSGGSFHDLNATQNRLINMAQKERNELIIFGKLQGLKGSLDWCIIFPDEVERFIALSDNLKEYGAMLNNYLDSLEKECRKPPKIIKALMILFNVVCELRHKIPVEEDGDYTPENHKILSVTMACGIWAIKLRDYLRSNKL